MSCRVQLPDDLVWNCCESLCHYEICDKEWMKQRADKSGRPEIGFDASGNQELVFHWALETLKGSSLEQEEKLTKQKA